jgi:glutamate dehydrogenase
MTEEVAAGSLRNNYQQSLALSLAERRSVHELPDYALLMQALGLDRGLEALPSDKELVERGRTRAGLTRPELAVLLSYAKISLQHDLLESTLPDRPELQHWLFAYFPPELRERFATGIEGHRLRREIIATGITNAIVNRGGPAMAVRLADEARRSTADVAPAFLAVREVFALPALWQRIDRLDGKLKGDVQIELYQATRDLVNLQTGWFLRNGAALADLGDTIARHRSGVAALQGSLLDLLASGRSAEHAELVRRWTEAGVPQELARDVASLRLLALAPAITDIVEATAAPVLEAARTSFQVGDALRIPDLVGKSHAVAASDYYDRLALAQAESQLGAAQSALTRAAILDGYAGRAEEWLAAQGPQLAAVTATLTELAQRGALTVSQLLVGAGQLTEFAANRAVAPAPSARRRRASGRGKSAASGSGRAHRRAPPPRF